jgi:hypothetical protein
LDLLVLVFIGPCRSAMSENHMMRNDVRLSGRVASTANVYASGLRAASRCHHTAQITIYTVSPRLV